MSQNVRTVVTVIIFLHTATAHVGDNDVFQDPQKQQDTSHCHNTTRLLPWLSPDEESRLLLFSCYWTCFCLVTSILCAVGVCMHCGILCFKAVQKWWLSLRQCEVVCDERPARPPPRSNGVSMIYHTVGEYPLPLKGPVYRDANTWKPDPGFVDRICYFRNYDKDGNNSVGTVWVYYY